MRKNKKLIDKPELKVCVCFLVQIFFAIFATNKYVCWFVGFGEFSLVIIYCWPWSTWKETEMKHTIITYEKAASLYKVKWEYILFRNVAHLGISSAPESFPSNSWNSGIESRQNSGIGWNQFRPRNQFRSIPGIPESGQDGIRELGQDGIGRNWTEFLGIPRNSV